MKPLVKRTVDGRRYAVPSAPRYPAPESPPQPMRSTATGAESTPPQAGPRNRWGMAKLSGDEVLAIRADYAVGKWNQRDLAYIYGVSVGTIRSLLRGESYRHVKPTPTEQES